MILEEDGINFLDCLFYTRRALASQELDLLYSKIGLAKDGQALLPKPTYQISAPAAYTDFVKSYIATKCSLDVICVDCQPRAHPEMPSWVPDWTGAESTSPVRVSIRVCEDENVTYRAALDTIPDVSFSSDDLCMTVKGRRFDVVNGVGCCFESANENERPGDQSESRQVVYNSATEVFDALWRSMILNFQGYGDTAMPKTADKLAQAFAFMCRRLEIKTTASTTEEKVTRTTPTSSSLSKIELWYQKSSKLKLGGKPISDWIREVTQLLDFNPDTDLEQRNNSREWHIFEQSWATSSHYRRLFTSNNGWLGMTTHTVLPGDILCVLHGCSTPVVLRRRHDDTRYLTLIGQCYIKGVMHGELIRGTYGSQGHGKSPLPVEEFTIK